MAGISPGDWKTWPDEQIRTFDPASVPNRMLEGLAYHAALQAVAANLLNGKYLEEGQGR